MKKEDPNWEEMKKEDPNWEEMKKEDPNWEEMKKEFDLRLESPYFYCIVHSVFPDIRKETRKVGDTHFELKLETSVRRKGPDGKYYLTELFVSVDANKPEHHLDALEKLIENAYCQLAWNNPIPEDKFYQDGNIFPFHELDKDQSEERDRCIQKYYASQGGKF